MIQDDASSNRRFFGGILFGMGLTLILEAVFLGANAAAVRIVLGVVLVIAGGVVDQAERSPEP